MLSKRTIQDICYSTDKIKISLFLEQSSIESPSNSTAAAQIPKQAAGLLEIGENREKALVGQFVTSKFAPFANQGQTFTFTIPNLIHGLKTMTIKRRKSVI